MSILEDFVVKKESDWRKKNRSISWMDNMIEKMNECQLATHVGKFTHPDSKISMKIQAGINISSVYVTTESVLSGDDVSYTNAIFSGIAQFLNLELEDGCTVFEHAINDSVEVRKIVEKYHGDYGIFKMKLKNVEIGREVKKTESILKQVYFPIGKEEYHLLSILPNSSVLYELSRRIIKMDRDCIEMKSLEKENGIIRYQELIERTVIGFGGTKFQNISELNMKNKGRHILLESIPPTVKKRQLSYPRKDFWCESIRKYSVLNLIQEFHEQLCEKRNNMYIRNKIERIIYQIIDRVFQVKYALWEETPQWTSRKIYHLPEEQRVWLSLDSDTELTESMIDSLSEGFARWLIHAYKQSFKKDYISIGDAELFYIANCMKNTLRVRG